MIDRIIIVAFILYALKAYIMRKIKKPKYDGQIVWVTGASSGIGQSLAYEFNKYGAHVVLSARNVKQLQRVKNSCPFPDKAQVIPLDMTDYKAIQSTTENFLKRLQSEGKKLDVIVENAGVGMKCLFEDFAFDNHLSLFDVNVHGPYVHLKSIFPHFIKNKGGKIVGVISVTSKLATAYRSSYGASKHAFLGLLDSLRCELAQYGIKVCSLMPGYINTNISKNCLANAPGQKFGVTDSNVASGLHPDEFAKQAVSAIYDDQNQITVYVDWIAIVAIIIRHICPDLTFKLQQINMKSMQKVVNSAKKSD